MATNEYKKCPYCREDIKSGAIKCKHCHSYLDEKRIAEIKKGSNKMTENNTDHENYNHNLQDNKDMNYGIQEDVKDQLSYGNDALNKKQKRDYKSKEALMKRAGELMREKPYTNISQIAEEMKREGYKVDNEQQVADLLGYSRSDYSEEEVKKMKETTNDFSDKKHINNLVTIAWVILFVGIISALLIWGTMATYEVQVGMRSETLINPTGIALGFVSLIQGVIIWSFLLVFCSIAKNLVIIKDNIIRETD